MIRSLVFFLVLKEISGSGVRKIKVPKDVFCERGIGPPRHVELFQAKGRKVLIWLMPKNSKACNVDYQLQVNVDGASIQELRTGKQNYELKYKFEEDECSTVNIALQAFSSNRIKSKIIEHEFLVGSKQNCEEYDADIPATRNENDIEQRHAEQIDQEADIQLRSLLELNDYVEEK